MANGEWTVGELARASNLSRSTLLYYDRLGLLKPTDRTSANYRVYDQADLDRLEQICFYRNMGIPLKQIGQLLDCDGGGRSSDILRKRLQTLACEIARLRKQQREICAVLQLDSLPMENEMLSKERWVEILRAAGLSDEDMHNWHKQFEKMEPDAHQDFLESLGIKQDEIAKIRENSR